MARYITMTVGGIYGGTFDHAELTLDGAVAAATLAGYNVLDTVDDFNNEFDGVLVVSDGA